MRPVALLAVGGIVALAVLVGWHQMGKFGITQERVETLDPAKIELIRTPGGFLQVSEMRRVEEFKWQTSWQCPLVDCSQLPRTVSQVRVKAHFVYRIPLSGEWRLQPAGDRYTLSLPAVQVLSPVAFETSGMEIATPENSVFSPAVPPNRENLLRHLGPELNQRGASAAYLAAQEDVAKATVREFALKWMVEQGNLKTRPIDVRFATPG